MKNRACISINARCNLTCNYCHFGKKVNTLNWREFEMSKEDIKLILSNVSTYIKDNNVKEFKIGLVGSGEPLLSFGAIQEAVLFAANDNQKIKLYTITNGTTLNKKQIKFFHKFKDIIDLNFSLDGPKDIHEVVRKNYNKTFKNIIEYERLFGHKPTINSVVTRLTIKEQERVVNYFLENGFKNVNFSIVFGDYIEGVSITNEEYYNFLKYCKEKGLNMRQMVNTKNMIVLSTEIFVQSVETIFI